MKQFRLETVTTRIPITNVRIVLMNDGGAGHMKEYRLVVKRADRLFFKWDSKLCKKHGTSSREDAVRQANRLLEAGCVTVAKEELVEHFV